MQLKSNCIKYQLPTDLYIQREGRKIKKYSNTGRFNYSALASRRDLLINFLCLNLPSFSLIDILCKKLVHKTLVCVNLFSISLTL